jgi:hypothetical protein
MEGNLSNNRTAVKPSTNSDIRLEFSQISMNSEHSKGMVVDLGFVDDLESARILSWANKYMVCSDMKSNKLRIEIIVVFKGHHIVETSKESQDLYHNGLKSWALEMMTVFEVKDKFGNCRKRTLDEIRTKKLPLPNISNVKGRPQYMVFWHILIL